MHAHTLGLAPRDRRWRYPSLVERFRRLRDQKFYVSDISRPRRDQSIENLADLVDLPSYVALLLDWLTITAGPPWPWIVALPLTTEGPLGPAATRTTPSASMRRGRQEQIAQAWQAWIHRVRYSRAFRIEEELRALAPTLRQQNPAGFRCRADPDLARHAHPTNQR